jgi:uncharacterized protein
MFIVSPENFINVPWKNGLGYTKELAISPGSRLDRFDWRLSIATVSENGVFSDFTGYTRDLVLIEGVGLSLCHDAQKIDKLNTILSFAHFDGGSRTISSLYDGAIKDFNIMVRTEDFISDVNTFQSVSQANIFVEELAFIYGLSQVIEVTDTNNGKSLIVPAQHLLAINTMDDAKVVNHHYRVTGKEFILIKIKRRNSKS